MELMDRFRITPVFHTARQMTLRRTSTTPLSTDSVHPLHLEVAQSTQHAKTIHNGGGVT